MYRSISLFAVFILLVLLFGGSAAQPVAARQAGCTPTIVFDQVPPYGSTMNLTGHVTCAAYKDYFIAVYINVYGWWTKPTFAAPWTVIHSDGSWSTDITTGGTDEYASDIIAFLFPNSYTPPVLNGWSALPEELFINMTAYALVTHRGERAISFAGSTWYVKSSKSVSYPVGPGPNYFSDDPQNVWVDESGSLHLKIAQRDGKWYCSEVINADTAQYGAFILSLASPVDALDKNAVLGFFTWDSNAPQYEYREIDIEFSRWNVDTGPNAQYVVQPWNVSGNRHQFDFHPSGTATTHRFDWSADHITFYSWDADGSLLHTWAYTNQQYIPPAGGNIRLNLWLFNGQPPSDGKDVEVVVKSYQFIPAARLNGAYLPLILQGKR